MMTNFTVYDKQTGEIVRTGRCPEALVPLQIGGDSSLEAIATDGIANDVDEFVDTSEPIPKVKPHQVAVREARRAANAPKASTKRLLSLQKLLNALEAKGIKLVLEEITEVPPK